MSLSRHLLRLFADQNIRPAEVARRTKLDPSVFTRIKKGGGIAVETLVAILTKGLGHSQRDHQYLEAMSLWMAENTRTPNSEKMAVRIGSAESTRDKKAAELTARLIEIADALSEEDRAVLLEAVRKPQAVRLWLQSAAALRARAPSAEKPRAK